MRKLKYVFFDGFSGMSGDMVLASLVDLGADRRLFRKMIDSMHLPVKLGFREVEKNGLRALKVDVDIDRDEHHHHHHCRNFSEVEKVVRGGDFPDTVKDRAMSVFRRLFEAEARVHGGTFAETHLHEAAADDALVDIVGSCCLLELLGIGEVYCSPLNVGSGTVKASHGILPVPAPATAELLKGFPAYSAHAEVELVTPTGAALATTLAARFVSFPELPYDTIGYGAGSRDVPGMANILRAFCGELPDGLPGPGTVHVIESVIDDTPPQLLAGFIETALESGALDVNLSPVYMKKNRLGVKLTVLAPVDKVDALTEAIFRETTSIGVRSYPVERRVLERTFETVDVSGEKIRLKVSSLGKRRMNVQPEYEDCLKAAKKLGLPLKEIYRQAEAGEKRRVRGRKA